MLILDDVFIDDFVRYYKDKHPYEVPSLVESYLNEVSLRFSTETLGHIKNLLVTSDVTGLTYYELFEKLARFFSFKAIVNGDLSHFVFNFVFFYFFNKYRTTLEQFLGLHFVARDLYKDVAYSLYGSADDKAVEKVIKYNNSEYSIEKVDGKSPKSWDEWFYNICLEVAANSKCFSRKVGAVLVRDKSVISTGYNGPPRGIPPCDQRWSIDKKFAEKYKEFLTKDVVKKGVCPRRVIGFQSGQGLEICVAGHAERNALINAARNGVKTKGTIDEPTTLYMNCGVPCSVCLVEIINSGVTEIVITSLTFYDQTSEYLLQNSNLKVRLFDFLKK